jgi:hypothetical protein
MFLRLITKNDKYYSAWFMKVWMLRSIDIYRFCLGSFERLRKYMESLIEFTAYHERPLCKVKALKQVYFLMNTYYRDVL